MRNTNTTQKKQPSQPGINSWENEKVKLTSFWMEFDGRLLWQISTVLIGIKEESRLSHILVLGKDLALRPMSPIPLCNISEKIQIFHVSSMESFDDFDPQCNLN